MFLSHRRREGGTLENQFSSNFCKTTPYEEVVVKHSRAWSCLKIFFPFWSIHTLGFPALHRCQETWIIRHIYLPLRKSLKEKKNNNNSARSVYNEIRIWPCSLTLPVNTLVSFSKKYTITRANVLPGVEGSRQQSGNQMIPLEDPQKEKAREYTFEPLYLHWVLYVK